jgi:hypothetical protein
MAGQLQDYTVDQLAGAIALTLGALGSLLLVIWQSRCLCRCRIGLSDQLFCFDCTREPPPRDPESASEQPGAEPEPEPEPEPERLIPGSEPEPEPESGAGPGTNP